LCVEDGAGVSDVKVHDGVAVVLGGARQDEHVRRWQGSVGRTAHMVGEGVCEVGGGQTSHDLSDHKNGKVKLLGYVEMVFVFNINQ
jgi:hypothetical protein